MFLRVDKLQIDLPAPKRQDPNAAAALQELLGGKYGEMSTLGNYMFQSFNFRSKSKLRPFYSLVAAITAEELGHVELVSNGVAIPVGLGSAADVPGRFEVVIANIVAPVLQRIAPDLAARLASGGTLLLAGINTPAEAATREAFSHVHLEVLDRNERDVIYGFRCVLVSEAESQ